MHQSVLLPVTACMNVAGSVACRCVLPLQTCCRDCWLNAAVNVRLEEASLGNVVWPGQIPTSRLQVRASETHTGYEIRVALPGVHAGTPLHAASQCPCCEWACQLIDGGCGNRLQLHFCMLRHAMTSHQCCIHDAMGQAVSLECDVCRGRARGAGPWKAAAHLRTAVDIEAG